MHPVHDVDALLLLALALAAKRRPAELEEIVAATDLIQASVPSVVKLVEAFARLSAHGLIGEGEGRFGLTPEGQAIVEGQPRKADTAERLFGIREKLAACPPRKEQAAALPTAEQLNAAILAHRAAGHGAGKNLLLPKPKPEGDKQRPGQRQRKPLPARRRKD